MDFKDIQKQRVTGNTLRIAYILERFPSATEYFILNEILGIEEAGVDLNILVIRKQKLLFSIDKIENLKSSVVYLPQILWYMPFLSVFFNPIGFFKGLGVLFSFSGFYNKWSVRSKLKKFRYYCISNYFAGKLKHKNIGHVHAHFAFIPVDIARILSKQLSLEYSVTAHAQDIYTNLKKIVKVVEETSFLVTCTGYNRDYINNLTDNKFQNKIFTIYHGIEINNWATNKLKTNVEGKELNIISVARLVEKKGLFYLLDAVFLLANEGVKIKCTIVGEGPLRNELEIYIEGNRITQFVQIIDFQPQDIVKKYLLKSDVFVLPCVIAENGDIDGLPNAILESMAIGLPVISTSISAIPEAVVNRETGLVVNQRDGESIAKAILELRNNPDLYSLITLNAQKKIKEKFSIEKCNKSLLEVFEDNINGKEKDIIRA